MKVIITESRLEGLIIEYLDEELSPDYEWGPELHDFYRKDVKRHGGYEFEINGDYAYSYYDDEDYDKTLIIIEWLSEKLTSLFGNKWEPVFIKWFEKNSGLKVKDIEKI
jgi:hypothetical protein